MPTILHLHVHSSRSRRLCREPEQTSRGHPFGPLPVAFITPATLAVRGLALSSQTGLRLPALHPRLCRASRSGEPSAEARDHPLTV